MDKCPVCNKEVENKENGSIFDGITYYFCCKECKDSFEAEPRKYANCCE